MSLAFHRKKAGDSRGGLLHKRCQLRPPKECPGDTATEGVSIENVVESLKHAEKDLVR
jgi:hypothetical protein